MENSSVWMEVLINGVKISLDVSVQAEVEDLPSIPGLDWSADESFFKQQEQPRMPIKKIPYAKPIPWDFERAWMTNKLPKMEKEDSKRRRDFDRDWDKDNNNRKDRRNRGRDR
jgi:hypothetical protein